jgi:hypothetical protein
MSESKLHVQFGCGLIAPETWDNYDASPTLRLQRLPGLGALFAEVVSPSFPKSVRYGDIVRGLPLPGGSCKGLYCCHMLEHLSREDMRRALRNAHHLLADDGVFRLVVPDLEALATSYLDSDDVEACSRFMEDACLGTPDRARGFAALLRNGLGNSAHLWMWDFKGMSAELVAAGFHGIRRADFGDADDPKFAEVEKPGRWDGHLGIECRR